MQNAREVERKTPPSSPPSPSSSSSLVSQRRELLEKDLRVTQVAARELKSLKSHRKIFALKGIQGRGPFILFRENKDVVLEQLKINVESISKKIARGETEEREMK